MSEKRRTRDVADLPEDVRGVIRAEIESGLDGFRAGSFEARLRSGLARRSWAGERGRETPARRPALRRWAPAFGLTLAAAIIGASILFWRRPAVLDIHAIASVLERLPGIQSLGRASRAESASGVVSGAVLPAPSAAPLRDPLTALAGRSSPEAASPAPAAPAFAPRYTLEQKIEILTREQPIARALDLFKSKFGEV